MTPALTPSEKILGPRPGLTLVIENRQVAEIWVAGRCPHITIRDYDWGKTDTAPNIDRDGDPFTPITWRGTVWQLGLSLNPPLEEDYPMAHPKLRTIPLDKLHISKLNMRHARKAPDVSDILPSIRDKGLAQTLLVREEENGYGVIAGRRRYFALKQIAKENATNPRIPCAVMDKDDDAAAIEASIIENVARVPATEMEQYKAFGALASEGRTASDIATHFDVTEHKVRRILALAELSPKILKLYEAEEVDAHTMRALTLATYEQQAEWLALFTSETDYAPTGQTCKAWVTGGDVITTDRALFDLASYDGQILADLFGENSVFADPKAFWAAQSKAIAQRVVKYETNGWKSIILMERGAYFQSYQYEKRAKTKGGRVYVEMRSSGAVLFHEGYITSTEASRTAKKDDDGPAAIKPEMSGPVAEYIAGHRHAATRASLLGSSGIALRLMIAHMLVGSNLWTVHRHMSLAKKEDTQKSLENSRATEELNGARTKAFALFEALGVKHVRHNCEAYHLAEVFAALLALTDEETHEIMTVAMADRIDCGSPIVEALAHVLGTDMSAYWKPDPAFLETLKDKRAINAMIADIATPSLAQSCLTDTAKEQKQVLANRIQGEGCEANPDWRPSWMQMPPAGLVDGAPCPPADQWETLRTLFAAEDTEPAITQDKAA